MIQEFGQSTITEVQKSQSIRLWDVFFLGPFMIHLARNKSLSKFERVVIGAAGLMTIIYNGQNYLENRDKLK